MVAAGVWIGGLAVLVFAFLPETDASVRVTVLPRWSRTAAAAVGAVVVTGVYQGWRETGSLGAVTGTGYGLLLVGKLVLVATVLITAWFARRALTVAAARPDVLRRIVEREAMLGLAILAITSFLVSTPPARTSYAPPFSASVVGVDVQGAALRIVLNVAPTRVGLQTVRLRAYTSTGAVQPFVAATGALSRRGTSAGPVRITFDPGTPGQAIAAGVVVPSAGDWTLAVQVLTDATTDYSAEATYSVI